MRQIYILLIALLLIFLPTGAKCQWQTYYLTEGDFSLYMPHKPSQKVSKQRASKRLVETYFYQSCISDCIIAYSASFADFGKDSHFAKDPNTALAFGKAGALRNTNGKLTYESYIDYKGYPGKEHKIDIQTHQGLYVLIQRVYIINGKVYEMNVTTPVKMQFMPEHYRFLDSFKIGK